MLQGKLPIMAFVYDESFTKAIATFWALFNVIESSALYLSWQQCIIFLFNHSGLSMESWRLTLFGKHTFKVITIFCKESYDYNFRVTFLQKYECNTYTFLKFYHLFSRGLWRWNKSNVNFFVFMGYFVRTKRRRNALLNVIKLLLCALYL